MKLKTLTYILIVSATVAGFLSCEPDSCLRGKGDPISFIIQTSEYDTMVVAGMFHVYLVEDTLSYVEFQGGENELTVVGAEVRDSCLWLENSNGCFLRSDYEKIKAYVHLRHVRGIHINEVCSIESADSLITLRWIALHSEMAILDIKLNSEGFLFYNHVTSGGIYKFSGHVDRCKLDVHFSAQCDFGELKAREFIAANSSVSDFHINAEEKLKVRIFSSGNIYYSGSPEITIDTIAGTGRLLPWNEN
jgi:hypothetical protein